MNEDSVIIFGCGGHARSLVNVIRQGGEDREILLVDENAGDDEMILGCKAVRQYELKEQDCYIIAIGDNTKRSEVYRCLEESGAGKCISIISALAQIGIDAQIGKGTFVGSNVYIGPQTEIGNNTIINTGCVIEHEVRIGNHTHIAPNATVCGRTRIGNHVFCGAGSSVIDSINICDHVVIGAGAVVRMDITEPGTYVGVPARKIG